MNIAIKGLPHISNYTTDEKVQEDDDSNIHITQINRRRRKIRSQIDLTSSDNDSNLEKP